MLSFEFGQPHLVVTEPRISDSPSERVCRAAARRRVRPSGEWWLLIEFCRWRLQTADAPVVTSEASEAEIEQAIRQIDGEKLVGVEIDPAAGTSLFRFDLGGTLATWSDEPRDEQWSLHRPDGSVLSYRGDGRYSLGPKDGAPEDEVWTPLPADRLRCPS